MSLLNTAVNLLMGPPPGTTGYSISRSLRFNSSDSAYLSRTPASAGNRKTWTWAGWVKRSTLGAGGYIFSAGTSDTSGDHFLIRFDAADTLLAGRGQAADRRTVQVFRDASAWGHIVVAVDTTQATGSNRIRVYFNGTEITTFQSPTDPSLNQDLGVNATSAHAIGRDTVGSSSYFNGYLADVFLIDGQALTPSSFTEVSATTGQLIPRQYSGSYGTNGFKLTFSDNSGTTSATLGKDTSGNNNDWTCTNFSVAAGAGNDSLVDTPTSFGTDTSAGGEVRGNYPTLNPLSLRPGAALSNGNLDLSATPQGGTWYSQGSTMGVSSGSFYWEVTLVSGLTSSEHVSIGIASFDTDLTGYHYPGYTAFSYGYTQAAAKVNNGSGSSYGATYTNGDVIGISLNMSTGALVFYKNGTSQGTAFTVDTTKTYQLILGYAGGAPVKVLAVNFGQRPFAYTAPSGFKALCDTNLSSPLIAKPNTVMDVKLYTGNGSSQTISGVNFSPDFIWLKARSSAFDHGLIDIVRGAGNYLVSNSTAAEASGTTAALTSDGFTLGGGFNNNGVTYVSWMWDAGTSTVTNTQGSITSSVRANASAGFSVISYVGTGSAGASIGHGLGVAPAFALFKNRSVSSDWQVYHVSLGNAQSILLQSTAAAGSSSAFNSTSPTSTIITLGAGTSLNNNGSNHICYAFAPVVGYSSFGSYTGNGSTDGPFVFCGFRPRWLLIKSVNYADTWVLIDAARETYNVMNTQLRPNSSNAESVAVNDAFDFLSNGFKVRGGGAVVNTSSAPFIYAAFAESPFQYARAR